jgi:hypothetical protein
VELPERIMRAPSVGGLCFEEARHKQYEEGKGQLKLLYKIVYRSYFLQRKSIGMKKKIQRQKGPV